MALILILETATPYCSVALSSNGKIVNAIDSPGKNDHAALLASYIRDIFLGTPFTLKDLDAVAVSKGPGSYTGLRIGVSSAKGLCFSLEKPLIGINTLEGMAFGMIFNIIRDRTLDSRTLFCPMIDARRMEVYCSVFDHRMHPVLDTRAEIIDENSFSSLLTKNDMIFFGDGAEKTGEVLSHHRNVNIIRNFHPSASHFCIIAEQQYRAGKFEEITYFEPYYLKQFVAGKPNVKGLE